MHRGRSIFVDSRLSREYLTCQLCKNIYQSPKLLPCFHSFCYSCLKALEPRNEPVLGCPTCQTKTGVLITDMDRLPANQIINRELIKYKLGMVKSKAKSMQCENCEARPLSAICLSCSQILCFLCVKKHQDTDLHTVLSVEQAKKYDYSELITQEMLCQAHDLEDLKYFCNNCEYAVCRVCVMAEHKSHEYTYLNGTTRLTESIKKLTQGARVTESKMAKLEVAMSESNMQVKRLEERATVVKNDIKRTFREYESLMKAKEKELLEEVDRLTEAELSKSDGPTALGLELERRKAWNLYANLLLNHGEANETVAMTSMLMNRFRAFSVENQSIETSNYKDIEYFAYHHLFSDALSVLGFVTNDPLQKLKEKQHNFKMLTASSLTKRTKDSSSDMGYRGFRDKSDKENLMLDPGKSQEIRNILL